MIESNDESFSKVSSLKKQVYKYKSKMDSFIDIHNKYISYQGATWQKHAYLTSWYNQVAEVMEDPGRFLYDYGRVNRNNK